MSSVIGPPRALLFDVFGTCVDWRSSVVAEGEALGGRLGLEGVDWSALADAWRARYQPQLETVRSGARPWTNLDVLHREALDEVLAGFALDAVPEADRADFNLVWHRLAPWPDTAQGLRLLKRRFIIAPNSNGHIALVLNLSKRAGLPWDAILGAEIARAYKPVPEAYLRNVEAVGLSPPEVMMVAAHNGDLVAAAACGLRTVFVRRPTEHGPRPASAESRWRPSGQRGVAPDGGGAAAPRPTDQGLPGPPPPRGQVQEEAIRCLKRQVAREVVAALPR